MAWISIKRILPRSVREHGISQSVDSATVVEVANVFLGEGGRAISFRSGDLKIVCRSPVYAQEIKLREDELVSHLLRLNPHIPTIRLKFVYSDDTLEL